jgi:hypothetical protein
MRELCIPAQSLSPAKKWHTLQDFYRAVKSKHPASHKLVRDAKKAVEEAAKEVADIISEL